MPERIFSRFRRPSELLRHTPTVDLTPPRLRWLEHLEREGPSEWSLAIDGTTQTCAVCKSFGWTRLHRDVDHFVVVGKHLGPLYELTGEGRAVLKAHRDARPALAGPDE